jgi:hypothetical protein
LVVLELLLQPITGMQKASKRAKSPTARTLIPKRRTRAAKSIRRPVSARVEVAIQRELLLEEKVMPLVLVREVVVKVTLAETAAVVSATGAEVVQVTPAGAVPEAMTQESVTVPVKVAFGVRTTGVEEVPPAVTVTEVEVFPLGSVTVKSGVSTPVPLRADVIAAVEALVTTESWPVAAPLAVGVKTTLIAQVAPIATDVPQLLLAAKAPVAAMLVMVSGVSPVLVRVAVCPLEWTPTVVDGTVSVAGVSVADATGAGMAK